MSNRSASCSACAVVLLALAGVGDAASDAPLVQAARDRDAASVRALLAEGADVNAAQPDGTTALHWAAHWDDYDTADLLIRRGADVNAENELGATPLWLSSVHGSASMIRLLLQAGADVNAALPSGETPLMTAARTGIVDAVEELLSNGADVDAREGSRGQTALMWAVAQGHPDIVRLLIEQGADIRARSSVRRVIVNTGTAGGDAEFNGGSMVVPEDRGGYTPLLFAARHGDVESAGLLLDAGADANDTAPTGTSVLVVAAHGGHTALARYLLERGADPNAAEAGYTALHAAILRGDHQMLQALLMHGADPNTRLARATPVRRLGRDWAMDWTWVGATPFWMAAMFGDAAMMRALAEGGAAPDATLEDGTTPLMAPLARRHRRPGSDRAAVEAGTLEAVRTAEELGIDIHAANAAGNTALHYAAASAFDSVVEYLVSRGAEVDLQNAEGQTPLAMTAVRWRRGGRDPERTAELLRSLGARE
ncbi:MAG: ankyrin repeat domain-containing protein [Acidobacteria bacterium]|nr:ankyrin repeat domain-containing protein [Acidobacteriota bacterium]